MVNRYRDFGVKNKGKIEFLVNDHQREISKQIEDFHQSGLGSIRQELVQAVSFEVTLATLINRSGSENTEEFYSQHPNLSFGMIAFLSLFDCRSLSTEQIRGIDFFDHRKINFNYKGINIPFVIIKKDTLVKETVFIPFVNTVKPVILKICQFNLNAKIYLKLLLRKIGDNLFRKKILQSNQSQNFFDDQSAFYSLNDRIALNQLENNVFLQNVCLSDETLTKINHQKRVLFSYGVGGIRLYSNDLELISNSSYSTNFQQKVMDLQMKAVMEISNQVSMNKKIRQWVLNSEQKVAFRKKFYFWSGCQDRIDHLNETLQTEKYPFKFLSKEEVFENQLGGLKNVVSFSLDEIMTMLKIFSWFPKGTFKKVKFLAKKIYNPDPRNIRDYATNISLSDDFKQVKMLRFYRSEIKRRLEDYREYGQIILNKEGVLIMDDIYFIAMEQNDGRAIRVLLKNLIQWIGIREKEKIFKKGKRTPGSKSMKVFVEEMVKYLNVRMGQLAIRDVDQKIQKRFHLFDELFLSENDRPTFDYMKLK